MVSQQFADERLERADSCTKQQATLVDRLKKELKEERDTLSHLRAFGLKSGAVHPNNKLRPADIETINVNPWRAMKEKQAVSSQVFFYRNNKETAADHHKQTAELAGTTTAAALWTPVDWDKLICKQMTNFKVNHNLGIRESEARNKSAGLAQKTKRSEVLAGRRQTFESGRVSKAKKGVRINGQVEVHTCNDQKSNPSSSAGTSPADESDDAPMMMSDDDGGGAAAADAKAANAEAAAAVAAAKAADAAATCAAAESCRPKQQGLCSCLRTINNEGPPRRQQQLLKLLWLLLSSRLRLRLRLRWSRLLRLPRLQRQSRRSSSRSRLRQRKMPMPPTQQLLLPRLSSPLLSSSRLQSPRLSSRLPSPRLSSLRLRQRRPPKPPKPKPPPNLHKQQ